MNIMYLRTKHSNVQQLKIRLGSLKPTTVPTSHNTLMPSQQREVGHWGFHSSPIIITKSPASFALLNTFFATKIIKN